MTPAQKSQIEALQKYYGFLTIWTSVGNLMVRCGRDGMTIFRIETDGRKIPV